MKKIESDKWKHFYVGIFMGISMQAFFRWLLPGQLLTSTIVTFLIVVAISYGFEVFSKITGKGHYEMMDAVAAVIGGVLGMAGVLLIQLY